MTFFLSFPYILLPFRKTLGCISDKFDKTFVARLKQEELDVRYNFTSRKTKTTAQNDTSSYRNSKTVHRSKKFIVKKMDTLLCLGITLVKAATLINQRIMIGQQCIHCLLSN